MKGYLFSFTVVLVFYFIEVWVLFYNLDWPQPYSPPTSVSFQHVGLQVHSTTPGRMLAKESKGVTLAAKAFSHAHSGIMQGNNISV